MHIISSGGMYGAEAVVLGLSHAFTCRGDAALVASFANGSQQLHERAVRDRLPALLIACSGPVSRISVDAIRRIVSANRPDVIHAHGYKADLYAWFALCRQSVPLVSTCHTWYDNDLALRVYGWLDRWVLRRFERVVAVSAEVEQRLLAGGVPAARIRRIRNGIDLVPFTAAADRREAGNRPLCVGLVGRLAPEKGVDVFLEAAALVLKSMPGVRFAVFGEGPDRAALEAQISRLDIGKHVMLAGHRTAMAEVYGELDLLVSASRQEGLPIALLEGMASGLPVVATTVGEIPAVVVPGETGLLVPPGEASALARAILQVLGDTDRRLALGQAARRRIETEFSVQRMAEDYRAVYREAIEACA